MDDFFLFFNAKENKLVSYYTLLSKLGWFTTPSINPNSLCSNPDILFIVYLQMWRYLVLPWKQFIDDLLLFQMEKTILFHMFPLSIFYFSYFWNWFMKHFHFFFNLKICFLNLLWESKFVGQLLNLLRKIINKRRVFANFWLGWMGLALSNTFLEYHKLSHL